MAKKPVKGREKKEEKQMNNEENYRRMQRKVSEAERVLIGIGGEWKIDGEISDKTNDLVRQAYQDLYQLVQEKDYFLVTTVTDGAVYHTDFNSERFVAPCGNIHWKQCADACTKDIWEEGEVLDGICPHCGAPLVANTIQADHYLEEGYLPMWKKYQMWLSTTLNRNLVVLELGEGFKTPTVIRWPFEKTVFFNQKAWMFRVNKEWHQTAEEIKERSTAVAQCSVNFIANQGKEA